MSPLAKVAWMTYPEAAGALGVDVRTIKRWMGVEKMRTVLGAVRQGKQWRILRPVSVGAWAARVREAQSRTLDWGEQLRRKVLAVAKQKPEQRVECLRLWLACWAKAVKHEDMLAEANEAIALLFEVAWDILQSAPGCKCSQLKRQFTAELQSRGAPEHIIKRVMGYWPDAAHFARVNNLSPERMETIRQGIDYALAQKEAKRLGLKQTNENLCQFLHLNLRLHINDTGEKLPEGCIDRREPQKGLAIRTVKKRHSRKRGEAKRIGGIVNGALTTIPGTEPEQNR